MRNISFMLTTQQIRDRTKTVTRRMGWTMIKVGDQLQAVEKSQGLGKGGKVNHLCVIRVVAISREHLNEICTDPDYGRAEMIKEGFPPPHKCSDPGYFVEFYCSTHRGCHPNRTITRIEFEYL
jgi:hypothetical protein